MHGTPRIFYATKKVNGDLTKLFAPYVTSITPKRRSFLLISCTTPETTLLDQIKPKPSLYPPNYPTNYTLVSVLWQQKGPHLSAGLREKLISLAGNSSRDEESQCRARPRSQRGRELRPKHC